MNKGRFGRSVRPLAVSEYTLIVDAGFEAGVDEQEQPAIREGRRHDRGLELAVRPVVERLSPPACTPLYCLLISSLAGASHLRASRASGALWFLLVPRPPLPSRSGRLTLFRSQFPVCANQQSPYPSPPSGPS